MFKKADANLLWYVIGLALAGIILFIIFKFWSKIVNLFIQQ
jgi:hypothetical protein